jgi:arylsulfatase A-like enzyme
VSLLRRHEPYFAVFYTGLPDAVHHQYWQYMEPEKFSNVNTSDVERYGGVIEEIYERLDRALGRLLGETSPDTLVVIASDHGGEANCEEDYRWADIHTENFIEPLRLTGSMTPGWTKGLSPFAQPVHPNRFPGRDCGLHPASRTHHFLERHLRGGGHWRE